jgi:hypothetical protein
VVGVEVGASIRPAGGTVGADSTAGASTVGTPAGTLEPVSPLQRLRAEGWSVSTLVLL